MTRHRMYAGLGTVLPDHAAIETPPSLMRPHFGRIRQRDE